MYWVFVQSTATKFIVCQNKNVEKFSLVNATYVRNFAAGVWKCIAFLWLALPNYSSIKMSVGFRPYFLPAQWQTEKSSLAKQDYFYPLYNIDPHLTCPLIVLCINPCENAENNGWSLN